MRKIGVIVVAIIIAIAAVGLTYAATGWLKGFSIPSTGKVRYEEPQESGELEVGRLPVSKQPVVG